MKKNKYHLLILSVLTSFLLVACQSETPVSPEDSFYTAKLDSGNGGGGNGGGGIGGGHHGTGGGELTQQERDGLIHMRIEEKLARDVYIVMGDLWNYEVFLNIQLSEQKHMDAIKRLLVKYNVPDPITDNTVGVFPDPQFQTLYNQYIVQGTQSLEQALLAGITIEELDIADLVNQLSFVDNQDIIRVYQNLKAASENHLTALTGCTDVFSVK